MRPGGGERFLWHSPQSRSTSFLFQALLCYESSTRWPCSYTVPIPESSTTFSVSAISGLQRCDTNTGSVCETQRSAQVGTSGNKREQGKTGRPTNRNKRPTSGNKGREQIWAADNTNHCACHRQQIRCATRYSFRRCQHPGCC